MRRSISQNSDTKIVMTVHFQAEKAEQQKEIEIQVALYFKTHSNTRSTLMQVARKLLEKYLQFRLCVDIIKTLIGVQKQRAEIGVAACFWITGRAISTQACIKTQE